MGVDCLRAGRHSFPLAVVGAILALTVVAAPAGRADGPAATAAGTASPRISAERAVETARVPTVSLNETGANDFRISDMGAVDGNSSFGAFSPSVAYNAADNEYLVVWYGDDDSGSLADEETEIYGQRIDAATGAEIGSDFRISDMGFVDGDAS